MAGDGAASVDELGELAEHLARGAAQVIRAASAAGVGIATKSTETDLVTTADRASEAWLRDEVRRLRPHDGVLGEEGGETGGDQGAGAVRWVVDPIDGTVNFVLGLPQYAVSVAAQVDGSTVAGAVCNPVSGELYRARRGGGAFLGEQRLSGPREVPLARAVVGTGFGYDSRVRARQVAVVAQLLPIVADVRRMGSAALDLCAVAAGRLDAYYESGLQPWDYAAGLLIAEEAGCRVIGPPDGPPGSTLLAVCGPGLVDRFADVLARLRAHDTR